MKSRIRAALAAALGAIALAASTGALAHDRGHHDGPRGHGWGHYRHVRHSHHSDHTHCRHEVIRGRLVIHEPPPVAYERRAYYASPAIVIAVGIPSLVIPLR